VIGLAMQFCLYRMNHFVPATAIDGFIEDSHDFSTHITTLDRFVLVIGIRAHIASDSPRREIG
jgi:hypothetical protein